MFQHIDTDNKVEFFIQVGVQQVGRFKRYPPFTDLFIKIVPAIFQVIFIYINGLYPDVFKLIKEESVVLSESRPRIKQMPLPFTLQLPGCFFYNSPDMPAAQKKQIKQKIKKPSQNSVSSYQVGKLIFYRIVGYGAHNPVLSAILGFCFLTCPRFHNSPKKPIEKNCTPTTTNKRPRISSGRFPIASPRNSFRYTR